MLQCGIGNFVRSSASERVKVCGSHDKFNGGERGAERGMNSSKRVARRGGIWLSYARPLAGKQKSGISGNRRRPKPTPWE